MGITRRRMSGITPSQVFAVLRDGRSYGTWVVGTRAIRDVEGPWPQPGSAIHYTVGYGPLKKEDKTLAKAYEPDERLELQARAWPAGTAKIVLTVEPADGGTLVAIDEEPSSGLAKTLHNPAMDLLISARNVETLRRLERLAAGRP